MDIYNLQVVCYSPMPANPPAQSCTWSGHGCPSGKRERERERDKVKGERNGGRGEYVYVNLCLVMYV